MQISHDWKNLPICHESQLLSNSHKKIILFPLWRQKWSMIWHHESQNAWSCRSKWFEKHHCTEWKPHKYPRAKSSGACFNSLTPRRFQQNLRKIHFKLILVTDGCDISSEIALIWTSLDLSDKSTLVQVMAWCRQATSHYLNQCWPRSLPPYGVTRPQWVSMRLGHGKVIT